MGPAGLVYEGALKTTRKVQKTITHMCPHGTSDSATRDVCLGIRKPDGLVLMGPYEMQTPQREVRP